MCKTATKRGKGRALFAFCSLPRARRFRVSINALGRPRGFPVFASTTPGKTASFASGMLPVVRARFCALCGWYFGTSRMMYDKTAPQSCKHYRQWSTSARCFSYILPGRKIFLLWRLYFWDWRHTIVCYNTAIRYKAPRKVKSAPVCGRGAFFVSRLRHLP